VWREIVRVQRNIPGSENLKLAKSLNSLGAILEEQGQLDEAETTYRDAFTLTRSLAGGEHQTSIATGIKLGHVLELRCKSAEAELVYAAVVELFYSASAKADAKVLNSISWLLATCNYCAIRDGPNALRFANAAVELDRDYDTLGTLAAAHAESGDFAAAASTQRQAIAMLRDRSKIKEFTGRLQLYESNTPCRIPAPAMAVTSAQLKPE
jgi:tetratricopeptide (TPR) repeat protein